MCISRFVFTYIYRLISIFILYMYVYCKCIYTQMYAYVHDL